MPPSSSPHLDTSKSAFEGAIQDFVARVAKDKSVGLFYFAGHGLQLNWRNYLIPVDAILEKAEDVPKYAVDLKTLLDGLSQARNPMNIVILDACRDNPFALDLRTGKGLSQIDAPVGTMLAYSTAPGNTASDGDGDNGLYTAHLLKEMRAPEAKIEDVFKTTRYKLATRSGFTDDMRIDFVVVAREEIEVLAGRFDAFRAEGSGYATKRGRREFKYWVDPNRIRRPLAFDRVAWNVEYGQHRAPSREGWELVAFSEAPR